MPKQGDIIPLEGKVHERMHVLLSELSEVQNRHVKAWNREDKIPEGAIAGEMANALLGGHLEALFHEMVGLGMSDEIIKSALDNAFKTIVPAIRKKL